MDELTEGEVIQVLARWVRELRAELHYDDDLRQRVAEMEVWMRSGMTPEEIVVAAQELDPAVVGAA